MFYNILVLLVLRVVCLSYTCLLYLSYNCIHIYLLIKHLALQAHPAEINALQAVIDLLDVPKCNCDRCKRLRAPEDDEASVPLDEGVVQLPLVPYHRGLVDLQTSGFAELVESMKGMLVDFKACKAIARLTFR